MTAQIAMYDKLTHVPSGRTCVAMRGEERNRFANEKTVWVAWDDADSYPRAIRVSELQITGHAGREGLTVYRPGHPSHGKTVGELGL